MALGADGAQIDIYDPTYFVAYAFDEKDAVSLGGPQAAACNRAYRKPGTGLEDHAAVGRDSGRPGRAAGRTVRHHQGLTHRIEVRCP